MSTGLINFFNSCDLFSQHQHGFLKGRSTQTAIFAFLTNILEHFENGKIALGMLLDLTKAYDCLDRDLLIRKLEYGVRGNVVNWFKSYINNRRQ